jgi:hypothetical protein
MNPVLPKNPVGIIWHICVVIVFLIHGFSSIISVSSNFFIFFQEQQTMHDMNCCQGDNM